MAFERFPHEIEAIGIDISSISRHGMVVSVCRRIHWSIVGAT